MNAYLYWMEIKTVNLAKKFDSFSDHWNPRILGELNGQSVKVAKFHGEFIMHNHENEDEMFMVIEGNLKIELEDKTLNIAQGEFVIIPKGVNHKPIAIEEVKVLLFEPSTTLNTGNVKNEMTKEKLDSI